LTLQLIQRLEVIPAELAAHHLTLAADGGELIYTYDTQASAPASTALLKDLISRASGSRTSTRRKARSKTSSSTW